VSINDPHLEAEMDLETRYPNHSDPAPPRFAECETSEAFG
jgi:hypothetical protein